MEGDLAGSVNVLGSPGCADPGPSGCNVKSAEQDDTGGFVGSYGPPSTLDGGVGPADDTASSSPVEDGAAVENAASSGEAGAAQRRLEEAEADTGAPPGITNPVYCIGAGSSFLFTIADPYHYPVYLRDSVLNTNPDFDYGAFLDLADEMGKA